LQVVIPDIRLTKSLRQRKPLRESSGTKGFFEI
jgi:hypothetical protein